MIKTCLAVLLLLLTVSVPSLAKNPVHSKGGSPSHSGDPVASAKKNYDDAAHKCGRAESAYGSYFFSGGKHEESKTRSLRNAKDSACNAKMGAETKYLNALNTELKVARGNEAAKQKAYDSAPPEGKAAAKAAYDKAKGHAHAVSLEISKHSMGHRINPKKH